MQGRVVASVEAIASSEENLIAALQQELEYQAARRPVLTEREQQQGRAVTIMGDQTVPYQLLKRVMTTCAEADFRDISLAVNSVPVESSGQADDRTEG